MGLANKEENPTTMKTVTDSKFPIRTFCAAV